MTAGALTDNLFSRAKVVDQLVPSMWLLDIVKSLTGVDVVGELVAPFVGPWHNVNAYGQALTNVSLCVESVSVGVTAMARDLGTSWQGTAADEGRIHLASVGASLRSDARTQADLALRYRELATAMQCGQVVSEMLLKAVLDTATQIAVWAAAGAATSQTRVGSVLGYGMATYKTVYLKHLLEEWAGIVAAARTETERFLGRRGPSTSADTGSTGPDGEDLGIGQPRILSRPNEG